MMKSLAIMIRDSLKGHEQEPNNVAVSLPGPIKNGKYCPPNIINPETKKPIGEIVLNNKSFCKQPELKGLNIKKIIFCNDGAFWGGLVLKKLAADNDLNKLFPNGSETPFIFPGGGLGVGEIRGRKDSIEVVPREKGHTLFRGTGKPIEQESTSVPAMIANYAKALGHNEATSKALGNIGDGTLVTFHEIPASAKLLNKLEKAGLLNLFEQQVDRNGKGILILKDNDKNPISKDKHEAAFTSAADKFYDGIGQVIADFVNGGKTDKAILSGNFIGFIMKKSESLDKNPQQIIKGHILDSLDYTGKNLAGNPDNFQILHVRAEDATAGGEIISQSKVEGDSSYYSIKRSILNQNKK